MRFLLIFTACVAAPPPAGPWCHVDVSSTPDLVRFEIDGRCSAPSQLSYELEFAGRIFAAGSVREACPDFSVTGEIALAVTTQPVLHATLVEVISDHETTCEP